MDQYTLLKDMLNLSRSNNMILSVEIIQEGMLGTKKSTICLFFPLPRQTKFFFFFWHTGVDGWGGGCGEGNRHAQRSYLDRSCKEFFPNNPNNVSSVSFPWPCRYFRSCYHEEAINNGGNSFPTCKHNVWVIV